MGDGRTQHDQAKGRGRPPSAWPDDPARLAARLDRVVRSQEELCNALDELSRGQADLIEAGDAPRLLGVLSERQAILTQLGAANDEFKPFRERWSELMESIEPSDRGDFTARIDALAGVIERIAQRDDNDRTALRARRVEVADRLGEVTRSRSAMSAYCRPGGGRAAPRYQDREG